MAPNLWAWRRRFYPRAGRRTTRNIWTLVNEEPLHSPASGLSVLHRLRFGELSLRWVLSWSCLQQRSYSCCSLLLSSSHSSDHFPFLVSFAEKRLLSGVKGYPPHSREHNWQCWKRRWRSQVRPLEFPMGGLHWRRTPPIPCDTASVTCWIPYLTLLVSRKHSKWGGRTANGCTGHWWCRVYLPKPRGRDIVFTTTK